MLRRSARIFSRTRPRPKSNDDKILLKSYSTRNLTVIHDSGMQIFYVELDNDKAVINYEPLGNNALNLYHTEVPKVFQGQGVAKVLAKAAFEHCVANDLKMKLSCEYLQKYFDENKLPEYSNRVIEKPT